ncbi:glycoside hydrolase superfamily [Aspergillus cavernicola]|uniref:Glycoside hydrolase superfamily n=1 Tax=Aspergillus cavernicola TaxID=176166 RepID=A0ABR4IFE4_9EURO
MTDKMNVNTFKAEDPNLKPHVESEPLYDPLRPVEELLLPAHFAWGTVTTAYQIDGAASQDGKGRSIWDTFSHLAPSRTNGESGDVACDHYNRVIEDVDLMASYGVEGIAFYGKLVDELLARNIEPVVTLYHWDVPQRIYDRYGAFLNTSEFIADFEHFISVCFMRFGDDVKKWVTFNEPYIISVFGYHSGILAPGRTTSTGGDSRTEPWRVGHTIILAHAVAVRAYARDYQDRQKGIISIVLSGHFYEPWDASSVIDLAAAQRRLEFYIAWFGDPIFLGRDYPSAMRARLGERLPAFTPEQLDMLRDQVPKNAFYGMNHYSTKNARALPNSPAEDDCAGNVEELDTNSEGKAVGPVSGMSWLRVAPGGFRKLLNWVWNRHHLPIIITENGCPCPGESQLPVEKAVDDRFRITYFGLYLDAISRALYEDGVKVDGYYVWSLMDNFEWSAGFGPRYGIAHTDYKTLVRTPKRSAWYLKDTFREHRKK